jgi:hypothetical protein
VDVVLSSYDEHTVRQLEPDAPVDQKISTIDDAGDVRTTSVKATVPGQIGASAPGNPRSPVADPVPMVPLARGHGCKRPPIVAKWSKPVPHADQVMFEVKLPPFHRPRSPLDLVVVKIVFGCLVEAFHQISLATNANVAPADDDKHPQKRRHWVSIVKKMQAQRYSDSFHL